MITVETVINGTVDAVITVGSIVLAGVIGWWRGKSSTQKKEMIKDFVLAKKDGVISSDEIIAFVDEHL